MKRIYVILAIFVLAFSVRFYKYQEAPIFPDEITWMTRAKESFLALRTFDKQYILDYFSSYPNAWWKQTAYTEAASMPLVMITGPMISYFGNGQSVLSRNLAPDYVVARLPLIILNSLMVVLVYLFAEKLANKKAAILASVLYALDPIAIATSRLVMNDGLLCFFMGLAIYSFIFIKQRKLSIALSGFSFAAAFLTKPHGVFVGVAWLLYIILSKNRGRKVVDLIASLLTSLFFVLLFWPESWSRPVVSIFEYLLRQTNLASGGIVVMHFLGNNSISVPYYFYLLQIVVRSPFYITFGLVAFIVFALFRAKKILRKSPKHVSIVLYVVLFLVIMSVPSQKLGVRYILPVWPFLYIAASAVIVRLPRFAVFALILFAVWNVWRFSPVYDYYYSGLISPKAATETSFLNLCYGAKESMDYINGHNLSSITYIGCSKSVIPYYYPNRVTTDWQNEKYTVVEESYVLLNPNSEIVRHFSTQKPMETISSRGLTLAKIYERPR